MYPWFIDSVHDCLFEHARIQLIVCSDPHPTSSCTHAYLVVLSTIVDVNLLFFVIKYCNIITTTSTSSTTSSKQYVLASIVLLLLIVSRQYWQVISKKEDGNISSTIMPPTHFTQYSRNTHIEYRYVRRSRGIAQRILRSINQCIHILCFPYTFKQTYAYL